jgi:peptidylprolyl isomerase
VSSVNFSRWPSFVALATGAATLAVTLAACGSDSTPSAATSSSASGTDVFTAPSIAETATDSSTCPTAPPPADGAPEWTQSGATGSVAVTGSTDTVAPLIKVNGPFSVTDTLVHTLKPGDGPVVPPTATVSVCYMGVNGRDGSVFDSSYERGQAAEFPLTGVVPGFQKAIAGQNVGSTVAVAMTPADGYPEGQPSAGIQKGDSLIFAIKVLGISG